MLKKRKTILFILLFVSAFAPEVRSGLNLECIDHMEKLKIKPKQFTYTGCKIKSSGETFLSAKYRVAGSDAKKIQEFLTSKFQLPKLVFRCCGWESPGRGSYISKDKQRFSINMYSDETLEKNWSLIKNFYIEFEKWTE